ncbi:MAG TPA: S8 family serine peptidase, partial [Acidimicrobiia bacterium]
TLAGSSPGCREPSKLYDLNGDGVFNVEDYAADPRVTDLNTDGVVDRGDLRVFADGLDDDGDGYVDDLSGWDAANDDGDEFDDRFFGHGTGRAGIVAPETNNALGVAGICPRCPLMNVRIDYTYVCSSAGVAKGAIFAVDHGARVMNMSLGCTTVSRMLRGAFEYARRNNVLAFDAMANEFSFHQNVPAVFHHVVGVGAVTADSRNATTTWLQKANFSNFGAHLQLVGPTDMPGAGMGLSGDLPDHSGYSLTQSGTSSSTPHAVGVAALVFSRARDLVEGSMLPVGGLALKDISAEEVRQILDRSAQDITTTDGTSYAVSTGWDKWTGYGRLNAKAAVDMVSASTIPPEADMTAPDWYALVDGTVTVPFYANARWASTFGYTLEFAAGVEPTSFTSLASASGLAANPALSSVDLASNFSATWDTTSLANGIYTLRLRVTDNHGNVGEDRRAVWVRHPDPQDQPGFPRQLDGTEGLSVALVDLDDDNKLEIIVGDGNGEVHALRSDGTELTGFPVHTDPPAHLPLTTSPAFLLSLVPLSYSPIIGGVAVADLDGDGQQEIVVGAEDGKLYCWHADATACTGFPVATDPGTARDQYGTHQEIPIGHPAGIGAVPALGDLDGDGKLEIVVGTIDQKLYVWHADGSRMAPFPIQVFDPSSASGVDAFAPRAIIASAAIADVDNDGANEIVISTDETYASPSPAPGVGGSGRAYVIKADGTIASGWPVKPTSINPNAVPLVAQGVVTSPVVAALNGSGPKQIALGVFLGDATIYNADGTTAQTLQGTFGGTGAGSDMDETTPEGGLPRSSDSPGHFYVAQGAFADIHGLGQLDYLAGEVGNGIVSSAAGSGPPILFDHLLSAWNATTGTVEPAFPRVIEDWQFFSGPAVGEISGDTLPEIIDSSGGYFVHAFNAAGIEPAGWPKLTGHWQTASPSIGDLDDGGHVDVVQPTRLGTLFVWQTAGATCQADQWRKFRHDEWNTGTYGADTRRPARIEDLLVSTSGSSVTLTWTAVGDDGKCGTAAAYDLRASATPITRANFASATPISVAPPAAAGTPETRTVTPPTGALFFALRAVDAAGNRG